MGSKRFGGALFVAHPLDHNPPHLHVFIGDAQIIIELTIDGRVVLSQRANAVRGATASEVRRVLAIGGEHFDGLRQLWEDAHGEN